MRIAQAFANRAAVALELSERVGREAVRALLQGQEIERTRLARELHDETGQALASILLGLKPIEREIGEEPVALDPRARRLGPRRRSAPDDRAAAAGARRLRPPAGARAADRARGRPEAGSTSSSTCVRPSTLPARVRDGALPDHPGGADEHRQARRRRSSVSIIVLDVEGAVRTVIEDDGAGFDPSAVREGALGLVGMRERVSLLGGRFEVESGREARGRR